MTWKISCYKTSGEKNNIKDWYDSQSPKVRGAFDAALSYLVEQPRSAWVRPKASSLKGDQCADLHEIRFKADNKQIRPLGFFGVNSDEFTLLLCAIEKGDKFEPRDACKQATKRRKCIESNQDIYTCRCFCKKTDFDCCQT